MNIRKKGRKLIKYLDVMKWVTLNNLQNRRRLPIGRIIIASSNNSFFRDFDRARERITRRTATMIRGE
jgi:hypothetical protein